jgi:hypothetical protein
MRHCSFLLACAVFGGPVGCAAPPCQCPAASPAPGAPAAVGIPASATNAAPSVPLVVWNGDSVNPKSDKWSACDTQPCAVTLAAAPSAGADGSSGLECSVKVNAGYAGCGWNWTSWNAAGASDVSGRKLLKFKLRISAASKELAPDPKSLRVGLRCAKSKACGVVIENIAKYEPAASDGAWHDISIPLTELKTENQDEWDEKSAWELALHDWAPTPRQYSAFLDDLRFE